MKPSSLSAGKRAVKPAEELVDSSTAGGVGRRHVLELMALYLRQCVDCPKCLTRYLMAASPYKNGSLLLRTSIESDEYLLYCTCMQPPVLSRWTWATAVRCAVSRSAYMRGFGTQQEIAPMGKQTRKR